MDPQLTDSGTPATAGLGNIYLLEFDLDTPFEADPGVAYWFGIELPAGPFGLYWEASLWGTGNSARATGAFPVTWSQSTNDMAFYLTSTEVPPAEPDVALFDPDTGQWHLRTADGVSSFYFGVPGDTPLMGDWDCDGIDTVAMYRESNGFVYYRNSNDFGVADGSFFFGIPGDIPIAGDWNGDGCDTFGIYRDGKVFYRNSLSTGFAALAYWFGTPGDIPFAGDFNGNGWDTVGLYRPSTGFVYYTNAYPAHESVAPTRDSFFFGVPSDRVIAGDWNGDGFETVGLFRSSDEQFYLRNSNSTGPADITIDFGRSGWLPAAGDFGDPA